MPESAVAEVRDEEGKGSGMSTESSVVPPRRAISSEQFSFTATGFDLCQDRLVTA